MPPTVYEIEGEEEIRLLLTDAIIQLADILGNH